MDTAPSRHRTYCDRAHTRNDATCTSLVTDLHGVLSWAVNTTTPHVHIESHGADLSKPALGELIRHLQCLHDQL